MQIPDTLVLGRDPAGERRFGLRVPVVASVLASPAADLADFVADGEDLALEAGALAALAELLEGLGLEPAGARNAALRVGDVSPGVEGAEEQDRAEQDEDQALAVSHDGRVVFAGPPARGVDPVDYQHGDQAADLPRGRGHPVARAAIAGGEGLGGDDEGERVSAEVEGEVADGDEGDGGGSPARVRHTEVHAARCHEQHRQHQERRHQPLPPRQPVREIDKARAARDRARRHRQQVLLRLLYEYLRHRLARLRRVRRPRREPVLAPPWHRRGAAWEGRVPARERGVDLYCWPRSPYVGQCAPVIKGESIEADI